jgi:hypothetical protein
MMKMLSRVRDSEVDSAKVILKQIKGRLILLPRSSDGIKLGELGLLLLDALGTCRCICSVARADMESFASIRLNPANR